jgi:MFS family permease
MRFYLKILLLYSLFITLAGGFLGPLYAVYVQGIGGDLLTAGAAYAIFSIVAGILILLLAKWEDHIKHQEKLLIWGRGLGVLGFLGYLFIRTPIELFIVQLIFGISTAIGTPAFDSLYSKNLDRGKFASEWGMWESMHLIAIGISAIVGGYIAKNFGFRSLFVIMFVISIFSFVASLFLLRKNKK